MNDFENSKKELEEKKRHSKKVVKMVAVATGLFYLVGAVLIYVFLVIAK